MSFRKSLLTPYERIVYTCTDVDTGRMKPPSSRKLVNDAWVEGAEKLYAISWGFRITLDDTVSMSSNLAIIKRALELSNPPSAKKYLWASMLSDSIKRSDIRCMVFLWRNLGKNSTLAPEEVLDTLHFLTASTIRSLRVFLLVLRWMKSCKKPTPRCHLIESSDSKMIRLFCRRNLIDADVQMRNAALTQWLRHMKALRPFTSLRCLQEVYDRAALHGPLTVVKLFWKWGYGSSFDTEQPLAIQLWIARQISKMAIICRVEKAGAQGYLSSARLWEFIDNVVYGLTTWVDNANPKKSKVILLDGTHAIIDPYNWFVKFDAVVRFPLTGKKAAIIPFLNGGRSTLR